MTTKAVRPSLIPDARLVRILEIVLPDTCFSDLDEITELCRPYGVNGQLKKQSDYTNYWLPEDVLRALIDMEQRQLARRSSGKGWKRTHTTESVIQQGLFKEPRSA